MCEAKVRVQKLLGSKQWRYRGARDMSQSHRFVAEYLQYLLT